MTATTRLALAHLRRWLIDDSTFSENAVEAIVDHAREHGTLEGSRCLRHDELDDATEAFVAGFEPVDYDSREWDEDPGLWTPHDAIDLDFPDPTPDQSWRGRTDAATLLAPIAGGSVDEDRHWTRMKPISGGAIDDIPPPYEPSEADRES
jgi:hypothetical protein